LSFCTFSFDHCVVCSSIYGLPLWYLQTLLLTLLYFNILLLFIWFRVKQREDAVRLSYKWPMLHITSGNILFYNYIPSLFIPSDQKQFVY